jgi:hypothetical protein
MGEAPTVYYGPQQWGQRKLYAGYGVALGFPGRPFAVFQSHLNRSSC